MILLVIVAVAAWVLYQRSDRERRELIKRVGRLPLRRKLRLALEVARDSRIPLAVRALPPLLILYLALPLDIIPDFIPVLGHVDDLLVLAVGVGLLLRFTPPHLVEEHVGRLEAKP
ncbi:MAG: DUF1232 domain-containing protein, partial [Dehalococcoidia bacterium]|nr:DUF1232 domain-containing protein [Dehalococcoidia bacterium]